MATEKKNQHYLPKFYLRNFSFQSNKKQIGVYNLFNKIFIQKAKLKTQGSKSFFYGSDGTIEDILSDIEGKLAANIKKIIEQKKVPMKKSQEHSEILSFVALTDLRNPVRIENMKNSMKEMESRLLEIDPKVDVRKFIPEAIHEDLVKLSLSNTAEIINNIIDLDYKLIVNNSRFPFISSDFPVVKYNQFLEQKKWPLSKSGYGLVGLEIFIPLNSKILLIFFDSGIYKIGHRKKKVLEIFNKNDVDQFNILQFINCFDTIYFDDLATETYIRDLNEQSKKFKKANISHADLSYLIVDDEDKKKTQEPGQENLLVLGSTDCEIKLTIHGIKIHSKGKSHKLTSSAAQLRPHAKMLSRIQNNF